MESGDHTLQGTVVSKKSQIFLMVMVPMKYGKWQETMASGSKVWNVK